MWYLIVSFPDLCNLTYFQISRVGSLDFLDLKVNGSPGLYEVKGYTVKQGIHSTDGATKSVSEHICKCIGYNWFYTCTFNIHKIPFRLKVLVHLKALDCSFISHVVSTFSLGSVCKKNHTHIYGPGYDKITYGFDNQNLVKA